MKVIFLKNINNAARAGEIKDVAKGYAMNYLFPQKLALPATEKNVRAASRLKQTAAAPSVNKPVVDKSQLAARLKSLVLHFTGKADAAGTLFAGITKETIARELTAAGLPIRSKQIDLSEPIKQAGNFQVGINVDAGMKIMITAAVVADKAGK